MITNIDNVGIAVTDLSRSIAFYEKLGFEKGQEYSEGGVSGVSMAAGSAMLFLFLATGDDNAPVKREPTLLANPPGLDHISFFVEDVDAAYAELRGRGVEFVSAPADLWGMRIVSLKDPDGNNLNLLYYSA